MPTLKIKYMPSKNIIQGDKVMIVPVSARLHIDVLKLREELMILLEKENKIYFTEEITFSAMPYLQKQAEIRKNDPDSIEMPIAPGRISALDTLQRFIKKHPELTVQINENSTHKTELAAALGKANIQLTPSVQAPAIPATPAAIDQKSDLAAVSMFRPAAPAHAPRVNNDTAPYWMILGGIGLLAGALICGRDPEIEKSLWSTFKVIFGSALVGGIAGSSLDLRDMANFKP